MQICILGTGPSGTVQLVEGKTSALTRADSRRLCAVKVLHSGCTVDVDAIVKHSELNHGNVVKFVDIFLLTVNPTCCKLCVVTELAADSSLWRLLTICPPDDNNVQTQRKSTWSLFPLREPTVRCIAQQVTHLRIICGNLDVELTNTNLQMWHSQCEFQNVVYRTLS